MAPQITSYIMRSRDYYLPLQKTPPHLQDQNLTPKNTQTLTNPPPPLSRHAPCPTATLHPKSWHAPISYSNNTSKRSTATTLPTRPQATHYEFQRDSQIRPQIIHKITEGCPNDTQDYIKPFCYKMITMTVAIVIYTSSNGVGKPWDAVWVPYHDGIDGTDPISL